MSDTKISEAVAWQYREDARHNGFDDDAWFDCTRELFNELSAIIGSRQYASVARGDGAWREDEAGWPTQVRSLYLHPQPAELPDASVIEHIAQQWDGCEYDAIGGALDIGEQIRRAGKRLSAELAEQQGGREQFEAWCDGRGYNRSPAQNNCGITVPERYAHPKAQIAWEAWQAALAATGKQQVGEVQGDAVADPGVIVGTLRAMVRNYSGGHCWDHLDARMCQAAADRIESLEAALAARQPGAQETDLSQFRDAVFCMENYTGTLPRRYWDLSLGLTAFKAEAKRLRALVDASGVPR